MKTKDIILSALLFLPVCLYSQNFADALTVSQNFYMGTGRATAMGSAFGGLGADISSISINPGGLGLYRSSEFTLTPVVSFGKVTSSYYGTTDEDTKLKMNFNNIGYVYTAKTGNSDGLVSFSLAFGYNRLNDLRNNISIRGFNPYSTITDFFYGPNSGPNENYLFNYQGRLADNDSLFYFNNAIQNPANLPTNFEQIKKIERFGTKGETFAAFGGNISDKLYFGVSIGYEYFNFVENIGYTEYTNYPTNYNLTVDNVSRITYNETYKLNGSGFNIKGGLIFRPVDFLRIGASIQSPTGYNMVRTYDTYMETQWYLTDQYGANTYTSYPTDDYGYRLPADELRFRLRTPARATGSIGVTLFKMLALDVDYEYVDYQNMRFNSQAGDASVDFSAQNRQIKDYMRATQNLRAGAEIKLGDMYLRGGAGYYQSPYKSNATYPNQYVDNNLNHPTYMYSAGIGFRSGGFIFDLGYSLYKTKESTFLYDAATLTEPATLSYSHSRVVATIGVRF